MSVTSISYYKENQPVYSYLVVCPSGGFVADETLSDNMYPNEGIVMSLIHSTTNAQVPVDLDFKTFANYKLDITSTQATRSTVLLIVIPINLNQRRESKYINIQRIYIQQVCFGEYHLIQMNNDI